MEITYAFIAASIIMCTSLAGVLFTRDRLRSFLKRAHVYIVAGSVGVLSMVLYGLIGEGLEHFDNPLHFGFGALVGVLAVVFASRIIPEHHHHSEESDHVHTHLDGRHVLVSDAIHNVSDGVILVPAFLAGPIVGIGTAIGIFIHEFIAEIAEFFVLKESGYSDKQALLYNFFSSASILIGVIIALVAVSIESIEPWLFALAAGAFAYLIFIDLLPSIFSGPLTRHVLHKRILAVAFGALIMFGIMTALPHEHDTGTISQDVTAASLRSS